MVRITRDERFELEKMGVPMKDDGISSTLGNGKKKTYYLCESDKNMEKLAIIRHDEVMLKKISDKRKRKYLNKITY